MPARTQCTRLWRVPKPGINIIKNLESSSLDRHIHRAYPTSGKSKTGVFFDPKSVLFDPIKPKVFFWTLKVFFLTLSVLHFGLEVFFWTLFLLRVQKNTFRVQKNTCPKMAWKCFFGPYSCLGSNKNTSDQVFCWTRTRAY